MSSLAQFILADIRQAHWVNLCVAILTCCVICCVITSAIMAIYTKRLFAKKWWRSRYTSNEYTNPLSLSEHVSRWIETKSDQLP